MTTKPQPDDVGNADAQVLGVILQFVVEAAINAQAANDAGAIVLISGAICPSGFGDHKKTPRWGDRSSFEQFPTTMADEKEENGGNKIVVFGYFFSTCPDRG
jgi:hypothetical protein